MQTTKSSDGITIRHNLKWAKVSGSRGKWFVAKGWKSSTQAEIVIIAPTKDAALIYAKFWVEDQD